MKYATRMFVMTLTLLPVLASAQLASAQLTSSDKVVTKVPFEFRVGDKIVPAGECIVQRLGADSKQLVIRNVAAKTGLLSTAAASEGKKDAGTYALVFDKVGDRYFLSAMKIAGSRTIYQWPQSRAESEMLAQHATATQETLVASLR